MRCYDIGTLRSYLDGELKRNETDAVRLHLSECRSCHGTLDKLSTAGRATAGWLATPARPTSAMAALARAHAHLDQGERPGWRMTAFARYRLALAGAAAMALVALLALTPMHTVATDLLAVFRVQKFAAVTIDPGQFPALPNPGKLGQGLVASPGTASQGAREVTLDEAARAVDFAIRQPAGLPAGLGQTRVYVSNPIDVSYTVDLSSVKEYLAKAGVQDVQLPTALDGATLRATLPTSVALIYGMAASGAKTPAGQYLVIGESRGPMIEIPDGVDVDLLREQVLAIPILPPGLAAQLRAIKDWRHTMVIPVPPGTHRDVSVAGVPGLLIDHDAQGKTLMWQKDAVLYVLFTNLSESDLMRIANGLR